jgi:hypothetical protein
MAIKQELIDLINADIDNEISHEDKSKLAALLIDNEEAREIHSALSALCGSIESTEAETPPPHLRYVIMNSVKPTPAEKGSPGFLEWLLAMPAFKYSATFAAGVILTLSAVSSDQLSNSALDDVTGLVGTIADPVRGELLETIAVDNTEVVGQVSLRSSGPLLILDFDLVTNGPIEIDANYSDRTIWFNGFGQLEGSGTTISAKSGSVSLGMEGKRRYAVYLHNGGEQREVTVKLRFSAGGEVVHEARLNYKPAK